MLPQAGVVQASARRPLGIGSMKARARSTTRRKAKGALATFCLLCLCWAGATYAQNRAGVGANKVVVVAQIEGMIDLGQGPFVERVLQSANAAGASAVILDVNTF